MASLQKKPKKTPEIPYILYPASPNVNVNYRTAS